MASPWLEEVGLVADALFLSLTPMLPVAVVMSLCLCAVFSLVEDNSIGLHFGRKMAFSHCGPSIPKALARCYSSEDGKELCRDTGRAR